MPSSPSDAYLIARAAPVETMSLGMVIAAAAAAVVVVVVAAAAIVKVVIKVEIKVVVICPVESDPYLMRTWCQAPILSNRSLQVRGWSNRKIKIETMSRSSGRGHITIPPPPSLPPSLLPSIPLYPLSSGMKALGVSTETFIRLNAEGMLIKGCV